jgi:hypothetical protein
MPSPTDKSIPAAIAADLDEAKRCLAAGCPRACAVMARRCIQAACIEKGFSKGELVQQIKELRQGGVITEDVAKWATTVRWVGNDAAHPDSQAVGKDDAEECLMIAEQFLHVIYVTTAAARKLAASRGKTIP